MGNTTPAFAQTRRREQLSRGSIQVPGKDNCKLGTFKKTQKNIFNSPPSEKKRRKTKTENKNKKRLGVRFDTHQQTIPYFSPSLLHTHSHTHSLVSVQKNKNKNTKNKEKTKQNRQNTKRNKQKTNTNTRTQTPSKTQTQANTNNIHNTHTRKLPSTHPIVDA
jgi:hypothetical protein